MAQYETGTIFSTTLPSGLRDYYEQLLLDTLRVKSILVPYATVKEDFAARDTGVIIYTEVFDTEPNWNSLAETDIWLTGAYLDSRTVQIQLEIHGDVLKLSDYNEVVNYWNNGDLRGLVRGKLGQNMVDYLDILARNSFMGVPDISKIFAGGVRADRYNIVAGDLFNADFGELARTHLEELDVPGVQAVADEDVTTIVCVTTPRVIHDIRTAVGSDWLDVQNYHQTGRKFTGEVGMWAGVRYVRTNRMRLRNHGAITTQTTLNGATVRGQGAAATVDDVYSVGQTGATPHVVVTSSAGFSVGQYVTIHDQVDVGPSNEPVEGDGTQETRRIVGIDVGGANRLSFDKPLLKAHASGDFVTNGIDIHGSIFMGGPAVVYGVAERPHPLVLPKIDDLGMVQRYSWRGFLKFQTFRPEFIEVHETAGTTD